MLVMVLLGGAGSVFGPLLGAAVMFLVVTVPLFVAEGDVLRIDTRTGEYQTRV